MFSRREQRLIKECLISLYNKNKRWMEFPVYYIPCDCSDMKSLGLTVRGLHQIDEIPWPAENCIVICEYAFVSIVLTEVKHLIAFVADQKNDQIYDWLPDRLHSMELGNGAAGADACIEQCFVTNVIEGADRRISQTFNEIALVKPQFGEHVVARVHDIEETIEKHVQTVWDGLNKMGSGRWDQFVSQDRDEVDQKLRSYIRHVLGALSGASNFWTVFTDNVPYAQTGLASDLLACLSNICVPCHYVVKSRFKRGFGTTGAMRRHTSGMPIMSIVAYDRLYRSFAGSCLPQEVEPHARRGHIRHLWKEAGLNRFSLPDNTVERIKLVHRHKVRRIYVHPTWVGQHKFETESVDYEIVTGEMPLRGL